MIFLKFRNYSIESFTAIQIKDYLLSNDTVQRDRKYLGKSPEREEEN